MHDEVGNLFRRLGIGSSSGASIDYSAFEDRFRGSSHQVKEAQRIYLEHLAPPDSPGKVVDLGCGRGELLELLTEAGYDAIGVDVNKRMVEVCRKKGLDVIEDEGTRVLERTERGSLKAVLCLQVVEHLFTSEIERLIDAAMTALRPGGVLVMETINPRSLHALGNHFFADTSHIRPVHPETLRFICEQSGFRPVELIELSPHPAMADANGLPDGPLKGSVQDLLGSVFGFQDYSVVATKPA